MSTPKYPSYKDVPIPWISSIPEHWDWKPVLGAACERDEDNKGMKEDNLLSLSYGNIVNKDINTSDGLLPESFETYQIVRPGDIVLRLTDLQNDKRSLRSALVTQTGIITSAYLALKPESIDPKYLGYLLRAYDVSKVFYSMGGGLRQSMKYGDIKRMPLVIPTKAEQSEIASFLDRETTKIDALITEQQRLTELLQEKRQAVISHAVTKGLNPNAPMKDSGVEWLGDVPEHWVPNKIGAISSLKGRLGWQGLKADEYREQGPYVVSSAHFEDRRIQWEECPRVSQERYDTDENIQLAANDILLMKDGAAMGKLAFVDQLPGPACLNSHLLLFRPREVGGAPAYDQKFAFCFMQTRYFQEHIRINGTGATFLGISQDAIGRYKICLPPLPEQVQIAIFLDQQTSKIDHLIAEQQRLNELLKQRRSALISAAVTGQIDVRGVTDAEAGEQ